MIRTSKQLKDKVKNISKGSSNLVKLILSRAQEMWSVEKIGDIRDDCMKDILDLYPEIREKLVKSRIEINHKTSSTMARFTRSYIEISAFLLAESTQSIFFQTLIMKGLIRSQICVKRRFYGL